MLPYGTLWQLDEKLHPAAPRVPPTVARRRGRALFLFFFLVAVLSLFMFPYYFARLRRLRVDADQMTSDNLFYGLELERTQVEKAQEKALQHFLQKLELEIAKSKPLEADNNAVDGEHEDRSLAKLWQGALYDTAPNTNADNHFYYSTTCTSQFAGASHYLYRTNAHHRRSNETEGLTGTVVVHLDDKSQRFQQVYNALNQAEEKPHYRGNGTTTDASPAEDGPHCELAFLTHVMTELSSRLTSLSSLLLQTEKAEQERVKASTGVSHEQLYYRIAALFSVMEAEPSTDDKKTNKGVDALREGLIGCTAPFGTIIKTRRALLQASDADKPYHMLCLCTKLHKDNDSPYVLFKEGDAESAKVANCEDACKAKGSQ